MTKLQALNTNNWKTIKRLNSEIFYLMKNMQNAQLQKKIEV